MLDGVLAYGDGEMARPDVATGGICAWLRCCCPCYAVMSVYYCIASERECYVSEEWRLLLM